MHWACCGQEGAEAHDDSLTRSPGEALSGQITTSVTLPRRIVGKVRELMALKQSAQLQAHRQHSVHVPCFFLLSWCLAHGWRGMLRPG